MTTLTKNVTRKTKENFGSRNKPLVVTLENGDVIATKEFGTKTWYRIPIKALYAQLVRQANNL